MMLRSVGIQASTEDKQDSQSAPGHVVTGAQNSRSGAITHLNVLLNGHTETSIRSRGVKPPGDGMYVVVHSKMLKAVESLLNGLSKDQSWESMQIADPPCNAVVEVEVSIHKRTYNWIRFMRKGPINDASGVKLGALFDDLAAFREHLGSSDRPSSSLTLKQVIREAFEEQSRCTRREELCSGSESSTYIEERKWPRHVALGNHRASFRIRGLTEEQERNIFKQRKAPW